MNPSPTTPTTLTEPQGLDWSDETGAQTAEYGIVTLAAVGFAGVLAVVLAGTDVKGLLLDIVKNALSFG
jgi:Flp pilus assembly pilin Flp